MNNSEIDHDIIIAFVATIVNFILALVIPILFNGINDTFLNKIKMKYIYTRNSILLSSFVVFVFVYFSLKITPGFEKHFLRNIVKLNTPSVLLK